MRFHSYVKGAISRSKSIFSKGAFSNNIVTYWIFFAQRCRKGERVRWVGLEIEK